MLAVIPPRTGFHLGLVAAQHTADGPADHLSSPAQALRGAAGGGSHSGTLLLLFLATRLRLAALQSHVLQVAAGQRRHAGVT